MGGKYEKYEKYVSGGVDKIYERMYSLRMPRGCEVWCAVLRCVVLCCVTLYYIVLMG